MSLKCLIKVFADPIPQPSVKKSLQISSNCAAGISMFKTDDYTETHATLWSRLPDGLRHTGQASAWANANRAGEAVDSFLEGPCFDQRGNLICVDIPFGRVFCVAPDGTWRVAAQYDGWPNGLKVCADGSYLVTDYQRGLVRVDPKTGATSDVLRTRFSESFKGVNDLTLAPNGDVLFTDQGQTGLHDPSGRVYRRAADGALTMLISNGPSPNGIALSPDGKSLFVGMTRDNAVWRAALMPDGSVSKVGRFVSFFGATGPDGIAFDSYGRLWVAHPSGDSVWIVAPTGEISGRVRLPAGAFPTNLAFDKRGEFALITASAEGALYRARVA
jgi:gluconolactonase